MAVKNFPDISPDANPSLTLESNTSSFESTLNKNVQHMELPGARWRGSVAFSNRTRQEANKIKAFMTSLGGQVGRFYLTPFDAYQSGTMSGAGVVDGAVLFGSSTISTKGWEGDQDELFKAGDYIEVNGELKMVPEDVAAPQSYIEYTGTNYMPSPFDPESWTNNDTRTSITNIAESNPSGSDVIGEIEQLDSNSDSINDSTTFPVVIGDTVYCSIMAKTTAGNNGLRFRFFDSTGFKDSVNINTSTGVIYSGGVDFHSITNLSDGYFLIQVGKGVLSDDTDYGVQVFFEDGTASVTAPTVGNKIKAQAIYAGTGNDFPAQLLATADIPIAPPLRKSLAGGESITVGNPKGKFYLGSNDQSWDINVNGVQSMGFDFIEDVN